MSRIKLFAVLALVCLSGTANAQQVFNDSQIEEFLQVGGITPEAVGMGWYRECQIYGQAVDPSANRNEANSWRTATNAEYRAWSAQADRLNSERPDLIWALNCRPNLYFPESADSSARLRIDPVYYEINGQRLRMRDGNVLRYQACQRVYVLGNQSVLKPGCGK
jgi:hypothetical protein